MRFFLVFLLATVALANRPLADEYATDPYVYELTPSNFDKVIHKTNYTSIVKFYAPWCGYCQQLKPVWKKLAKLVKGDGKYAVNIAAVNCDKDYNKPLCSQHRVSGFPTLMVFRPPKYDPNSKSKLYRHTIEPYNGDRSLKSIHNFVTGSIKNYVKKFPNLGANSLKEWTKEVDVKPLVLLVTNQLQLSPLYKSLAIDFITTVRFGMITLKSVKDVDAPTFAVGESTVTLPIDLSSELPVLYAIKDGQFVAYDRTTKLNDKAAIAQWIVDTLEVKPLEGELSKREEKYLRKYRTGKSEKQKEKKVDLDEL